MELTKGVTTAIFCQKKREKTFVAMTLGIKVCYASVDAHFRGTNMPIFSLRQYAHAMR